MAARVRQQLVSAASAAMTFAGTLWFVSTWMNSCGPSRQQQSRGRVVKPGWRLIN
jgi:uncharacterized lipoprotein YbaY